MDRSVLQLPPKKESGQSLVEFAVMLTLLLILVSGILEAGRALFTYLAMRDAAQEGALYASTRPTDTAGIRNRVCNASNMMSSLCDLGRIEEQRRRDSPVPDDRPRDGIFDEDDILVEPTVTGQLCMGATGGVSHGVRVTVNYPNYQLAFALDMQLVREMFGRETISISASAIDTILTPACP